MLLVFEDPWKSLPALPSNIEPPPTPNIPNIKHSHDVVRDSIVEVFNIRGGIRDLAGGKVKEHRLPADKEFKGAMEQLLVLQATWVWGCRLRV